MMSDEAERKSYYLRIISMYLDLGTETIHNLFLKLINRDPSAFLQERKDVLSELMKRGTLNAHEYRLVTDPDPKLQKFDIILLIKLISSLVSKVSLPATEPQPMNTTLGADLYRLRKYRNKLLHISQAQMEKGVFKYLWDKISDALLRLSEAIGKDFKEQLAKRICEYKCSNLDTDDATIKSRLAKFQEWNREMERLKTEGEALIRKFNDLQSFTKETPKRYICYIKLLFYGGKHVLLEILQRQCDRASKALKIVLQENHDALKTELSDDLSKFLPQDCGEVDPSTWDISFIASVILISFSSSLTSATVKQIETIREARNRYAVTALTSMDQNNDEFFRQSTSLTHSLTLLSADFDDKVKEKCHLTIEQYTNLNVDEDETIDQCFIELRRHGANIKSFEDVHKEKTDELKDILQQMEENGIDFKTPHDIMIKITTVCEQEGTKKTAENELEQVLNVALENNTDIPSPAQSSSSLQKEAETLIRRLSGHPDVKISRIERNCITLFLSCYSRQGMVHLIDYIRSTHFDKTLHRISDELSFNFGEAFALRGNIVLESICGVLQIIRNEGGQTANGLSLAIECASSDGIRHVLNVLGDNDTTNSFNHISDVLSEEYKEKVTVYGLADLKELSDLYEGTDTDTSGSSRDLEEDDPLPAEYITGTEDKIKPMYPEDEELNLHVREIEKGLAHTNRINNEDLQPKVKPSSGQDFGQDDNEEIIIYAVRNREEKEDSDYNYGSTEVEDERSMITERVDVNEAAQILDNILNRVNEIQIEIVSAAEEVAALLQSVSDDQTPVPKIPVMLPGMRNRSRKKMQPYEDKRKGSFLEPSERLSSQKGMNLKEINEDTCELIKQVLIQLNGTLASLKELVSKWKDNFKLAYVGLADNRSIDDVAIWCDIIGQNISDLRQNILPLLFNIHVECGWAVNIVKNYKKELETLFCDIIRSTFLVTEQDKYLIRLDKGNYLPVFTVRVLAAQSLKSVKIKAMLLSENDINDCCKCDDAAKWFSRTVKVKGLELESNKIYFTSTRDACFRTLKLKDTYCREQFGARIQDYKMKYRVVFEAEFDGTRYWTLSLPFCVVNTSGMNTKFLAYTSIMWQCYGTETYTPPLHTPTELPWNKVENILQLKFKKLCPLVPLSEGNILRLKEMLFGTVDVPDTEIVSFEAFCENKMESTSSVHIFWKWILSTCKLIEIYLLEFWKNGLIFGFLSKETAEWRLKVLDRHLRHGTFILLFSEHHLPSEENIGYLKAYALTIKEEYVPILCLESSVYRRLGAYLGEMDSETHESLWSSLIRQCVMPINENEQRRIEKANKPGNAFLDELDKHAYKLPDLTDLFRRCGMDRGLEILHMGGANEGSVLALQEDIFRKTGKALEETLDPNHSGRKPESYWNYIIHHDHRLAISRKEQRNIGKSLKPGETFLNILNNCGYTLKDLKKFCETHHIQGILDILESSDGQEGYLQKTVVDVDIGGVREFREKELVDILKEKRSPDGCRMLKYIYPGGQSLEELSEKYA